MKNKKDDRHSGSTFDSFLEEQDLLQETEAVALKRVIAWQLKQAMSNQQISKQKMAKQLGTSRSQIDRLLDPSHTGISIATVSKAAHVVGKRIRLEIIEGGGTKSKKSAQKRIKAPNSRTLVPAKKRA
jgi:antitoxin HicB